MSLLLRWVINALALLVLPYIFDSIRVESFYAALIAAFVLGLVNALIRPILIVLTLPINILMLGLFTFVINGLPSTRAAASACTPSMRRRIAPGWKPR